MGTNIPHACIPGLVWQKRARRFPQFELKVGELGFPIHFVQSGRSVNLRTPSCHGKKACCGDAIVRVVSRSISAENLPIRSVRRSSRAESRVTIDRLLSCFFSRRHRAFKPDEQCQSNGRKLFLRSPRRNGKANASFIENRRKHSSSQSQRGKTLKKRVW